MGLRERESNETVRRRETWSQIMKSEHMWRCGLVTIGWGLGWNRDGGGE